MNSNIYDMISYLSLMANHRRALFQGSIIIYKL